MTQALLDHLKATKAQGCRRCRLALHRNCLVFGSGNPEASLMLVGEAPGDAENRSGEPFVGASGQLLDSFLKRADIQRETLYITNTVKCHPPDNQSPEADELHACSALLHMQIRLVQPKVLLALGATAGNHMAGLTDLSVARMRDQDLEYNHPVTGIRVPLLVSYHPSAILRMKDANPIQAKHWAKDLFQDLERAFVLSQVP